MSETRSAPPQSGMRRIPFTDESYEHPSPPLNSKRLLNFMQERAPPDSRSDTPLVSTPGLELFRAVGDGPILAMNDDVPGCLYLVSGTHFFRVTFGYPATTTVEDLGDVGSPAVPTAETAPWNAFITIAAGPTAAVVVVTPRAYTCGHAIGDPVNEITDPDFPGATSVAYVDGYFAFSSATDMQQWVISRLLDPTDFDALDFVSADAAPNAIRRLIAHVGQLWVLGEGGFEVWYDAGSSGLETIGSISYFPFRRLAGGVIPIGTNSPMAVCRADQSVFWLGWDGIVYRSDQYKPRRISTHAIEAIIGEENVFGHVALAHAYRGHWFYCLTLNNRRTLVYDISTQKWHERSTSTDGALPWQATQAAAVSTNSLHLLGDRENGNLYSLSMTGFDAGVRVIHQATMPTLWANTNRAFCARLEIEMEVGGPVSAGQVAVEWSDDGARSWTARRLLSPGGFGDTRQRVYTTRLGSFRQRTFRLTTHGLTRLYAVDADIVGGLS